MGGIEVGEHTRKMGLYDIVTDFEVQRWRKPQFRKRAYHELLDYLNSQQQ